MSIIGCMVRNWKENKFELFHPKHQNIYSQHPQSKINNYIASGYSVEMRAKNAQEAKDWVQSIAQAAAMGGMRDEEKKPECPEGIYCEQAKNSEEHRAKFTHPPPPKVEKDPEEKVVTYMTNDVPAELLKDATGDLLDELEIHSFKGTVWISHFFGLFSDRTLRYSKDREALSNRDSSKQSIIDLTGCVSKVRDEERLVIELQHFTKKQSIYKAGGKDDDYIEIRLKSKADLERWLNAIEANIRGGINQPFPNVASSKFVGYNDGSVLELHSCAWLNVLLERLWSDMVTSEAFKERNLNRMRKRFSDLKLPGFVGNLVVQVFDLGLKPPEVKKIAMTRTGTHGSCNEIRGILDLQWEQAQMMAEITADLYINWPKEKFATIHVKAMAMLKTLRGRIFLYGEPELQTPMLGRFEKMPELEIEIKLEVGHSNVTSLSSFKDFLLSALRKMFASTYVKPNYMMFNLPFPGRKVNLRGVNITKPRRVKVQSPKSELEKEQDELIEAIYHSMVVRFFSEVLMARIYVIMEELFDPKVVVRGLDIFESDKTDIQGLRRFVRNIGAAFPGMRWTIRKLVVKGCYVYTKVRADGTQMKPMWGIRPTGQPSKLKALFVFGIDPKFNICTKLDVFWQSSLLSQPSTERKDSAEAFLQAFAFQTEARRFLARPGTVDQAYNLLARASSIPVEMEEAAQLQAFITRAETTPSPQPPLPHHTTSMPVLPHTGLPTPAPVLGTSPPGPGPVHRTSSEPTPTPETSLPPQVFQPRPIQPPEVQTQPPAPSQLQSQPHPQPQPQSQAQAQVQVQVTSQEKSQPPQSQSAPPAVFLDGLLPSKQTRPRGPSLSGHRSGESPEPNKPGTSQPPAN